MKTQKNSNKTENSLLRRANKLFESFGLTEGRLLRLKSKTFFAISPPVFELATIPVSVENPKASDSPGHLRTNGPQRTCYIKKNDIIMYIGPDVVSYGDEAFIVLNCVYDERVYSLYIISVEDLDDVPDMIHKAWELNIFD